MKPLFIAFTLLGCVTTAYADDLSDAVALSIPKVKETSKNSFRKLHAGFTFKGYGDSPGHQAVLTEMKKFYKNLQDLEGLVKDAKEFPATKFDKLTVSIDKAEKLAGFVVMDDEVRKVFSEWVGSAKKFTGSKETKLKEIKVKKVELETKKIEKAIKREEKKIDEPIDPALEAKEARLRSLQEHYRFLQKQNRAVIRAGYTTPQLRANGYYGNGGFYYNANNHTYYPRSNSRYHGYYQNGIYCPPTYRSGSKINIIYRK